MGRRERVTPQEPEDEVLAGLEEFDQPLAMPPAGSYVSPALARMASQRLTLPLLASEIPKIRAAATAEETLAEAKTSARERAAAMRVISSAQEAKTTLFAAALPLIRTIATREYRRRQQWGSTIPLEDLMQDAIVGFFKGIGVFDPSATRGSATNYLGQWMLSEMRRGAEVMDHDLQVGHDAGERFRRVRALRSRLAQDLGREPTDQEISDASRDQRYVTRPGLVGRAPKEGEERPVAKGLTIANVAEERAVRDRVGRSARFAEATGDDEERPAGTVDVSRIRTTRDADGDPALLLDEKASRELITTLVQRTLELMALPAQQTEVISRRYGLAPFSSEESVREISRAMRVHRERVSRIVSAFADEMTRPGGVFHWVVSQISPDDLLSVGLGWIPQSMGPWTAGEPERPGKTVPVLTDPLPSTAPRPTPPAAISTIPGVAAWYICDYEDFGFHSVYPTRREVPAMRACPQCGRNAPLDSVRITAK